MTRLRPFLPFLAVGVGIAIFSMMDALMKSASIQAGAYNAVLWRSAIGSLITWPIWRLAGGRWPARAVVKVHALRASVIAGMATLFFWGLVRMPMAEAMALSFIAPLIALYLAAVMLGERIRRRAVAGSVLSLAGVLAIAAGQFGDGRTTASPWGLAAVLASAVLYAWNLILQRRQALLAEPTEVAFFQHFFVGLALLVAAPWLALVPSLTALADIAAGAALATASLMFLTWGYARAEAQALVPIEYTGFIWAVLLGWLWFAEPVTNATLGGAVLIVAGCWIAVGTPSRRRPASAAP